MRRELANIGGVRPLPVNKIAEGATKMGSLLDWIVYAISEFITHLNLWSPLDSEVILHFDSNCVRQLANKYVRGTVRAFDARDLLIHLRTPLQAERTAVDILVVTPASKWHTPFRLLVTRVAVRIFDAPSFIDKSESRSVGSGDLVRYAHFQ